VIDDKSGDGDADEVRWSSKYGEINYKPTSHR